MLKFNFASSAIFDHLYLLSRYSNKYISLYKRYKIFNGQEWKKITRYQARRNQLQIGGGGGGGGGRHKFFGGHT